MGANTLCGAYFVFSRNPSALPPLEGRSYFGTSQSEAVKTITRFYATFVNQSYSIDVFLNKLIKASRQNNANVLQQGAPVQPKKKMQ